uniref:DNA replication complex GINS protein PSF1 n=1 Tax=Lepeophtheirus salmonis TaxID=72036 RepID=D3PG82_LEPSM|nr:DNA replication complex GINS protein PSF1 [Lepeophtheirus salmonis]
MFIGERALDLVRRTIRTQDLLPSPFEEDTVRSILEEMKTLYATNHKEIEEKRSIPPAIHLRHAAIERSKRSLLAYIHHRSIQIRQMRKEFGPVLPPEMKANLCSAEIDFFHQYNKDLAGYMASIRGGMGVDLMTDILPPKSLYIEVRCIKDYGEMETEDGEVILLKKNTQHFLPRSQCEQLIRQGILQHVSA